jgi:hypothetical protein
VEELQEATLQVPEGLHAPTVACSPGWPASFPPSRAPTPRATALRSPSQLPPWLPAAGSPLPSEHAQRLPAAGSPPTERAQQLPAAASAPPTAPTQRPLPYTGPPALAARPVLATLEPRPALDELHVAAAAPVRTPLRRELRVAIAATPLRSQPSQHFARRSGRSALLAFHQWSRR